MENTIKYDLDTIEVDYMSYGLEQTKKNLKCEILYSVKEKTTNHPLVIINNKINENLISLQLSLSRINEKISLAYENLSTFEKLNYEPPNLSEIKNYINDLESLKKKFSIKHGNDLEKVLKFYAKKEELAINRLDSAYELLTKIQNKNGEISGSNKKQLQFSMWGSIFAMSSSITMDMYENNEIYNVLRDVNSNFSDMSNMEIWWETLWMNPESLTGLSSLVKGAYFESLVAKDTGGILFEHFNHPDTDIVIDGQEIQLKATDSISYINSVDDDITVIATSEIAERSDAIDSGISNLELEESIGLALGGSLIDVGDGVVDGILTGLGCLGTLSTIKGMGHAAEKYNNGGDGQDAILEGIEIAVVGTVKGLCDTYDFGSKVVTSRQGKAVGRGLLKAGNVSFKILVGSVNLLDKALTKNGR